MELFYDFSSLRSFMELFYDLTPLRSFSGKVLAQCTVVIPAITYKLGPYCREVVFPGKTEDFVHSLSSSRRWDAMGGKERDELDHKIICHVSPFLAHLVYADVRSSLLSRKA
jgi:hypothetical protein